MIYTQTHIVCVCILFSMGRVGEGVVEERREKRCCKSHFSRLALSV